MSTQLDTRTTDEVVTGIAFIEGIDLDLEPACEHSRHHREHADEPAAYVVRTYVCPGCGQEGRTYLLCESGWAYMGTVQILCTSCRTLLGNREDAVRIVSVL